MESLSQMLSRNARLLGERTFLHFGEVSLSYAGLNLEARKLAMVLAGLGIRKGDPVGIYLPNGIDLITAFWACQVLGAVAVPMGSMLQGSEVKTICTQTRMSVIFADAKTGPIVEATRSTLSDLKSVLDVSDRSQGGIHALCGNAEPFRDDPLFDLEDVATVFFTSGTTGAPKGAMQTHFAQYSALRDMMGFNHWRFAREVVYCALPLTSNFGCTCMMNLCMFAGGTLVVDERWDTRHVLNTIRERGVTFLAGPPTIFIYLVEGFDAAVDDLSSLKLCIAGGAPVPTEIIKRFEARISGRVSQGYGATEVLAYVTADPLVGQRKLGSAGLPIGSTSITILDEEGAPVPVGELGEICIDGDTVGCGYWGDADATARAFTPNGWLSGDIGRLDEEGYLYIVDRKKDLIISGGFNIYPIEVENLLYALPDIRLCAVVGLQDTTKGEIAVAAVKLAPDSNLSEDAIMAYCRENLSAYKVPRRVFFVDELPMSPIGKVLKRQLRESLR